MSGVQPSGNLLTLWPDALPPEAVPEYPTYELRTAVGGEITWEIDTSNKIGVLTRSRQAEPGELLRDADLRYELDWSENLLWRSRVMAQAEREPAFRELQWLFCKSSVLYYINTFCWTYDPRRVLSGLDPSVPFVTFPFQDDLLTWAVWLLHNRESGVIEKSREMGATWCFMSLASWLGNFYPGSVIYPSSLREEDVDNRTEDSLFGKYRFLQRNLPEWLRSGWVEGAQQYDRQMLIELPDTGSVLHGQKTASTAGVGGRATCLIPDEFARVEDAKAVLAAFASLSQTAFFISTPQGMGNEFARMAHDPRAKKKTLHWTLHPQKNREWYGKECAKVQNTPEIIAQEHEIQYETSTLGRVFPQFRSFPDRENPRLWVHIQEGPLVEFDPHYNVVTGMDFGMADPTSVVYAQLKPAPVEYHPWTRETMVFFDETEAANLTVFEWRYLLNHKGYRYDLHIGDMRTGQQRDARGRSWMKWLAGPMELPEYSEALGTSIEISEKPIVVKGKYNSEIEPVQRVRELLRTPGAIAFSRHGVPGLIIGMQNWAVTVDRETRKPIYNAKPEHDQWSHRCKALCYLIDYMYGQVVFKKRVESDPDWKFRTSKLARL